MTDTRRQEARGLNVVADIIQVGMGCGWQEIDQINDNGIDGLFFDRVRGIDTGTVFHVQVKCGDGWAKRVDRRPRVLSLHLGGRYLDSHRPRWNVIQGPVILVYVDFRSSRAWWCDLKADATYCPSENKGAVLLPLSQRFGAHSIGHLRRLRGFVDLDRRLDTIQLDREDLVLPSFSEPLKAVARRFYRSWAQARVSERWNPKLHEIQVSRVGWRHITRRGRGLDNITQSMMLLGAARRIVKENTAPYQMRRPKVMVCSGTKSMRDFLTLRSVVVFPNRQQAVVQVVLMRKQTIDPSTDSVRTQHWFYSVHEPRRSKEVH